MIGKTTHPHHSETMPLGPPASASTAGEGLLRHGLGALALGSSLCMAVAALYVAKSALGINLFAGHSPLHDWLYHLAR